MFEILVLILEVASNGLDDSALPINIDSLCLSQIRSIDADECCGLNVGHIAPE